MSPLPQPEQCSSVSSSSSAADSIALLVKASASIEEGQSSSSASLHDETPRRTSPLHQMTVEQERRSHMQQMSAAQRTNNAGRQQLDASILSRMVTASGPGGAAGGMPNIRVASMQEFRHASRNSLNSVPESSGLKMRSPNQLFYAPRRATASMTSNQVRATPDNPLLKMMEQRMAANKKPATAADETSSQAAVPPTKKAPAMVTMTEHQKSALNASINKWSGIGTHVASTTSLGKKCTSTSHLKTVDEKSTSKTSPILGPASSQNDLVRQLSNNSSGAQPRQPLAPSQEKLLLELIQTQQPSVDNSCVQPTPPPQSPSPMQLGSSAQDFVAQVLLQQQQQQQQQRGVGAYAPYAPVSQRGMARSAVSLAEIDRLRQANQSVQMRQQMAMQERMSQQCLLQRQRKSSSGNVRLASRGLPNELTMRKRRSSATLNDDTVVSSRTPSITSNTSSSKIHRSDSHSCVSGSMENLRLCSSRSSRSNMHNQRFSSSGMNIRNQSFSSGLNIQNSSVSSGLNLNNQSFSNGSTPATVMRRASSKAAMKRNTSSSSWIQSMISTQESAGKAALVAASRSNGLEQHLLHPVKINALTSPVKEEEDVMMKTIASPIQVTADEYAAPSIDRGSSSDVIIMSDLPDRIKFQNVQIDKKPIDVVKEALSSRGEDANIKPTVDMPDDFFKQCEEMYIQEAVDAVRSSDVDTLRQLAAAGKNLQCGNRFGETLIHLACRRSHQDVVAFLIKEAGVSIKVRDDFGRTPMHDACWRCSVDLKLMDLLIDSCPELLMLSDKRGHTPLDYARREHWEVLIPYLMEKKDKFRPIN
mmetsp:Transcript_16151/g.24423  ORF Transcript_16151/g.24423 Transcript_16151/m.24423 type:complete len:816 (-) Transcript_16151:9-2456(-)